MNRSFHHLEYGSWEIPNLQISNTLRSRSSQQQQQQQTTSKQHAREQKTKTNHANKIHPTSNQSFMYFKREFESKSWSSIRISPHKRIQRRHYDEIRTLDIDETIHSYLLSSGSDGYIYVYNLNPSTNTSNTSQEHQNNDNSSTNHNSSSLHAPPRNPSTSLLSQIDHFQTIKPLAVIDRDVAHTSPVCRVQWYPFDNGLFTSSSLDGKLKVWDASTLETVCLFNVEGKHMFHEMSKISTSHSLIAATSDNNIRLCDLRSGASTHTLQGHKDSVSCCRWSPRNEYHLATCGYDRTIQMWDIRKARPRLNSFQYLESNTSSNESYSHMAEVCGLSFTPDGLKVLSVGADKRMILWDAHTGNRIPIHFDVISSQRFDLVTRCPAITSLNECQHPIVYQPVQQKYIAIYDLSSGKLIRKLHGHYEKVNTTVLRKGGHLEMYSAGKDLEIMIWDTAFCDHRSIVSNRDVARDQDEWSD